MSYPNKDKALESIWDNIEDHIEAYFGEGEHDDELLDFIFTNDKARRMLWEYVAKSKLGDEIAEEVFQELPEGPEEDLEEDR